MVDDAGFDETAQFEMKPVPTVADEPGGIKHRTAPTLPAHSQATRRSKPGRATILFADQAEIVVDQLNVDEAALSCDIDKIVLPSLVMI